MSTFTFDQKEYSIDEVSDQAKVLVQRLTHVQEAKEKVAAELDIYASAEAKMLEMLRAELETVET